MTSHPTERLETSHLSPSAQTVMNGIANAENPSQLRPNKGVAKGVELVKLLSKGAITQSEFDALFVAKATHRASMLMPADAIPEDIPESSAFSANPMQDTEVEPWSPTAGMTNEGVSRERDAHERQFKDD